MGRFTVDDKLSPWRKIALASWSSGAEASIYGWVDVDATALERYIEDMRRETGVRVTVTHLVGKAAAIAIAENPEANSVLSLGRVKRRSTVDVFFSVVTDGGKGLAGQKVSRVDQKSIPEIVRALSDGVARIRDQGDTPLQKSQKTLFSLPSAALGAALSAVGFLTFDLGLDLRKLGVPTDTFGSVVVTNVGVFGIEQGFGPLIPHGRTAALVTVGLIREKVIAIGGQPQVRRVLTLGATFDHRIVDGHALGRIGQRLREVLEDPDKYLGPASAADAPREAGARVSASS